jgi:tRNA(Ile)-lysidine synthase
MKFFRNKVRLELLPLLQRKYNQNIRELLTNLANNAGTDYDYLEIQTQKIFSKHVTCSADKMKTRIDLKIFSAQHPAIKRMLIRMGIQWMKGDTNRLTLRHFREIENLLQSRPRGAIAHLPQGICVQKNLQYLVLFRNS